MATIDEIKQQAEAVKNATQVGENTAVRVGGALSGLADIAKAQEDNIGKKADKAAVDAELAKKANTADVASKFIEEAARVDAELDKKANAADVDTKFAEEKKRVDAELAKKANAEDVNNSMQELDKKLNRNLLAIEFDDDTGELNAIIGQDSTISSVSTDEDGNVIIEQNII